ncbi:hypothetical protein K431DRAFT_192161, partial [Polychaeton citri CBS 116435]
KRPRVPEDQRRRATVACANCRRLKEKCDGNVPCARCRRARRQCEVKPAQPRVATDPASASVTAAMQPPHEDRERIQYLETIATHFLGNIPLEIDKLRQVVQNIKSKAPHDIGNAKEGQKTPAELDELELDDEHAVMPVSQHTAHYSGEFSHWSFSQKIRRQIDKRLDDPVVASDQMKVLEYWRASNLRSQDDLILAVRQALPPPQVSDFLVDVYFRFAQTNHYFAERDWALQHLEMLYSPIRKLTVDDSAWACTMVMILSIGTQFAHMAGHRADAPPENAGENDPAEDSVGITMYHLAAKLMPDVLALASVESVQAFLLIAHFALPLDAHGLCHTYLTLSLEMAVQNGMHRKFVGQSLDRDTLERRYKLFWTTYSLVRRISILHGRPVSLMPSEIDVQQPSEMTTSTDDLRHNNVIIRLTTWLGEISYTIKCLRKCPKHVRRAYFERLLQSRQQLQQWWLSLAGPFLGISRSSPTFRCTAHLHLCYHLNIVFLGRPFVFFHFPTIGASSQGDKDKTDARLVCTPATLVQDAVNSARAIVDICNLLESTTGLARASYIEFSTCRAALLLILARSLQEKSKDLRDALALGITLLKRMAVSIVSAVSEVSVITAIEAGLRLLDAKDERSSPTGSSANAAVTDKPSG